MTCQLCSQSMKPHGVPLVHELDAANQTRNLRGHQHRESPDRLALIAGLEKAVKHTPRDGLPNIDTQHRGNREAHDVSPSRARSRRSMSASAALIARTGCAA